MGAPLLPFNARILDLLSLSYLTLGEHSVHFRQGKVLCLPMFSSQFEISDHIFRESLNLGGSKELCLQVVYNCTIFTVLAQGPFVLSTTHSLTRPIIPSFERPKAAGRNQELNILQGESLRIYLFCDQENVNKEKVWCKEELLKACLPHTNPVIFSEPEWKVLTMASNKKIKLGDSRKGCASVHMTTVEVEDSGLYWFGLLYGQKIDYLSPIKLVVHKGKHLRKITMGGFWGNYEYIKNYKACVTPMNPSHWPWILLPSLA